MNTIRNFILNEDLKYFDAKIASLSPTNTEVDFITRIMTLKFNIKYLLHHVEIKYDSNGETEYIFASHQDITEETKLYNFLKKEIYNKNEELKNKNLEIKEAHHNIKNNLNILLSLIRMEEHFKKDPDSILSDTKSQINAISIMMKNYISHRHLNI